MTGATPTPEELRAAADAFAKVGRPSLEDQVAQTLADANAYVAAVLGGNTAEAERLKNKLGVDDTVDDDDEEDDDDDF